MNLFNRLPGFARSAPGVERVVLRLMPRVLVFGTLVLGLPSLVASFFPWQAHEAEIALRITTVDILAISMVVLHWTVVLTVTIAGCIVMVMKGPAYVADPYPLPDATAPVPESSR